MDALPQYIRSHAVTLLGTTLVILLTWLLYRLSRIDAEKAVSFSASTPDQCKAGWKGPILDDLTIKVPRSMAIQCYAPATGQLLGLVNPSTPDGIDRVITKAAEAQVQWQQTSFAARRQVLRTLLKFVLDEQDSIVRAACLDSGKTRVDALFGEVLVTVEKLKWTIDHGEKALVSERRPTNLLMFYKRNEVRYEPLGVVAACVSWNYPFHNLFGPVISAMFTGNAIVVKNSEQTAWSSQYYISIIRSALSACGHNPDLVHTVSCWPATASHLTSHAGISHLTFIGSRPVAHEVAKSASKALTPLCIELGGKDAAIVLDDPSGRRQSDGEIARVASTIMRGVFQSAGQNCIGMERIIAMPQAYRRLIELLGPRIRGMRLGSDLDIEGVDMGAMISSASFDKLEHLIADAVAHGARLLVGGHRYAHSDFPKGQYFEPTLLVDVEPTMKIAREELFGPVCLFMRAENAEHAVKLANSTLYGLGGCVFGPTSSAAARAQLEKAANEMKTGMVAINDFAVFYAVQLPFGGIKGSGYGRFAGEEGLRSLCNVKSVCADRWPGLLKTSIPARLDYPMQAGAWEMGKGVVEMGYGDSWSRRVTGIRRLIGGA